MNPYQYKLWHLIVVLSFVLLCLWVVCGCETGQRLPAESVPAYEPIGQRGGFIDLHRQ